MLFSDGLDLNILTSEHKGKYLHCTNCEITKDDNIQSFLPGILFGRTYVAAREDISSKNNHKEEKCG